MKQIKIAIVCLMWGVFFLGFAGCAASPAEKKAEHIQRGNEYMAEEKFNEAIIEFRNALKIDSGSLQAMENIGIAYFEIGEIQKAYVFLNKARELGTKKTDVYVKLSTIYLLAHSLDEAREAAENALENEPDNIDALLLATAAAQKSEELDESIRILEERMPKFKDVAKYHLALGTLYLRKNNLDEAERSYYQALELWPDSPQTHAALGKLFWLKKDRVKAEEEFKKASELAPMGSREQIKLALLYVFTGKPDLAKDLLEEVVKQTPDFLPAWRLLAQIYFSEKKLDESGQAVEKVLEKQNADIESLLLRGRIYLAKRQTEKAMDDLRQVISLSPDLVQAHHHLARAYVQAGDVENARKEFEKVLADNPEYRDARLQLAELDIKTGNAFKSIDLLNEYLEKFGDAPLAYVLLGTAYSEEKRLDEALESFEKASALAPKDPRGPYLVGVVLQRQGKQEEAERKFQASLEISPAYVQALSRLVAIDLNENKFDNAVKRVEAQISKVPESGGLHFLLAKLYEAKNDLEKAESLLLKAIDLEPGMYTAYTELGKIYIRMGKEDLARSKFRDVLSKSPNNLGAMMMLGVLEQKNGNMPEAQAHYEKVLELKPGFAPAANNLAYIYCEYDGDLEKASRLAMQANEANPEDPNISDTFGWILFKQGDYRWALSLIQQSVSKIPENPEVWYHLGMVQYKLGKRQEAKVALDKALELNSEFSGAQEAKDILEIMK